MKVASAHRDRLVREALRRALVRTEFGILWQVEDRAALERRMRREKPDLLLVELDLLGNEAERLPGLLKSGCAVIVLASANDAGIGYEALGLGALALVEPPALDDDGEVHGTARFIERLRRLASLTRDDAPSAALPLTPARGGLPPLIALGASTGGPLALASVLGSLPLDCPAAVIVVQHIEDDFVRGFANWLGTRSRLPVNLAERGVTPSAGQIYVAGSSHHLVLMPSHQFGGLMPQATDVHVPSVDALFHSLAQNSPPGVAALLTGMGADGVEGLLALRAHGWHTIAQDETSSVVYGMPRAAVERGAVVQTVPLARMGPALVAGLARRRVL